jgi:hypothetical protein
MTHCTDGSWCCGTQNSTCCNRNLGFQVPALISPYTSAVATSTSATSTGTSKSSSNNGIRIGLGVALGVVVLAVAIMGIFLWRMRARQGRVIRLAGDDSKSGYPLVPVQEVGSNVLHEAPGHGQDEIHLAEMEGGRGARN